MSTFEFFEKNTLIWFSGSSFWQFPVISKKSAHVYLLLVFGSGFVASIPCMDHNNH